MSSGAEREDQTNPFPLEREKDDASPFLLERERSTQHVRADLDVEGTVESEGKGELESEGEGGGELELDPERPPERSTIRFTAAARGARRSLVVALGVHSLALLAFASLSLVRWVKGLASPPELALTVLAIGIALVHLRASSRLSRLGRDEKHDGAILASSFTSLRAVLVLKALVLFASLALSCFVLSMVVSLIASF